MVWKEEEIGCIFCVWTWEVQYFLFYAVLNKAHAFFADPKESRIYWDKTRKKKVRIENHSPSMLKLKINKLGQIWLYTRKMLYLAYSHLYKKKKERKKARFHDLALFYWSLYVYFNILYLLFCIMHKFGFCLRALEFAGIKGRWCWWVMMVVVRKSLSPSW